MNHGSFRALQSVLQVTTTTSGERTLIDCQAHTIEMKGCDEKECRYLITLSEVEFTYKFDINTSPNILETLGKSFPLQFWYVEDYGFNAFVTSNNGLQFSAPVDLKKHYKE